MPQYKIRPGHKLVVSDPDRPGETINRIGGDIVELTADEAAEYPGVLDLDEPVKAEPVTAQATAYHLDGQ